MLFCEIFYVWGIDFMGPFPIYFGFTYILLDDVYKWVEVIATKDNGARVIMNFFR